MGNAVVTFQQLDETFDRVHVTTLNKGRKKWSKSKLLNESTPFHFRRPVAVVDKYGRVMVASIKTEESREIIIANYFDGKNWGNGAPISHAQGKNAFEVQLACSPCGEIQAVIWQSNGISFRVFSNRFVPDALDLAVPGKPKVSLKEPDVRVTWNLSQNRGIKYIALYRRIAGDKSLLDIKLVGKVKTPQTSFLDGGIKMAKRYAYSIMEIDSCGYKSPRSPEVEIKIPINYLQLLKEEE